MPTRGDRTTDGLADRVSTRDAADAMWTIALAACQEPFATDRHDLAGFRIAAVSTPPAGPGEVAAPRAAVIADGAPWSDAAVTLRWSWVARAEDAALLDADSPAEAEGPAPSLLVPEDRRVLALVAIHGDELRRAVLEVPEPPAHLVPPAHVTAVGLPLEVATVTAEALAIDARRALAPSAAAEVAPGGFVRLAAEPAPAGDGDAEPLVRWMATKGTFFELDPHTTDWAAGELALDGDEIDEDVPRSDLAPGWVTFVALTVAGGGETAFLARDLAVGPVPAGVWVGGRFVPTDVPSAAGPDEQLRGRLTLDDTSPCGLALAIDGTEPKDTPSSLPCAIPIDGPFDPDVLLDQRCVRTELDGVSVAVAPDEGP